MLETLDLKQKLSKAAYAKALPPLEEQLRKAQYAAYRGGVAVVICLEGWDLAGKGEIIKRLTEGMDPRLFRFYRGHPPTPYEQRYHFLWRFQVALPNYGEMALFDHSWYDRVLDERCNKVVKKKVWRQAYQQINEFERWLADDGQVLIKFWLHISKKEQKRRLKEAVRDPLLRWKVTKDDKRQHRQYNKWLAAAEDMLAKTTTPWAPWALVPAHDLRWARVQVLKTLLEKLEKELARRKKIAAAAEKVRPLPREAKTSARSSTGSSLRERRRARRAS